MQVLVRDNNVDQALKALKKKMQREGIFREMKLRGHYEKPSEKKAREKAEAVRRARKLARKRAQREGLLPGKPAAAPGAAKARLIDRYRGAPMRARGRSCFGCFMHSIWERSCNRHGRFSVWARRIAMRDNAQGRSAVSW